MNKAEKLTVSMLADVRSGHRDRNDGRGLLRAVEAPVGSGRDSALLLRLRPLSRLVVPLMVLLVMLDRRRDGGGCRGRRGGRQFRRRVQVGQLRAEVRRGAREDAGQSAAEGFCIAWLVAAGGI